MIKKCFSNRFEKHFVVQGHIFTRFVRETVLLLRSCTCLVKSHQHATFNYSTRFYCNLVGNFVEWSSVFGVSVEKWTPYISVNTHLHQFWPNLDLHPIPDSIQVRFTAGPESKELRNKLISWWQGAKYCAEDCGNEILFVHERALIFSASMRVLECLSGLNEWLHTCIWMRITPFPVIG